MTPHLRLVETADEQADEARELRERRLREAGGGGTSGGMGDDWKEYVDRQLTQLHEDVRRLTGLILAAAVGPFLAIIGLYAYTGSKFDAAETRVVGVERRLSAIEVEQAKISGKLDLLVDRKQRSSPATP